MAATQKSHGSAPTLSVHDPEFKNLITVPLSAVHHLPPAHLEISRLVLCRKFDPRDPNSCSMGDNCKFVHIDMSTPELNVQSIHVNYAYRSLEEVQHETLPAGETLAVMAPNNRAPSQLVPSEMIIVTKGALNRHSGQAPLSHCAHYYYNRMCNRGERCGFLHCVYVDPSAQEFQRAPPRAGAGYAQGSKSSSTQRSVQPNQPAAFQATNVQSGAQAPAPAVVPPLVHHQPAALAKSMSNSSNDVSSCDLSESPRSHNGYDMSTSDFTNSSSFMYSPQQQKTVSFQKPYTGQVYRHNPYSLLEVTTLVA